MRVLLLLALLGCDAPEEPCTWENYGPNGWWTVEVENGCGLPTMNAVELGCDAHLNESTDGEGCSRSLEFACANGITLAVYLERDPDRQLFTFRGDGCVTTYTLIPKAKP